MQELVSERDVGEEYTLYRIRTNDTRRQLDKNRIFKIHICTLQI